MPDPIHAALKWASHNRYTLIALAVAALPLLAGCAGMLDGKVQSEVTGQSSTAGEIRAVASLRIHEYDAQIEELRAKAASLERQREEIAAVANAEIEQANERTEENIALAETVLTTARESPILAAAGGSAVLGPILASAGLFIDNRRKDKVVKKLKTKGAE